MSDTRRDALKKALIAAVAAATPASLLMAAGRVSTLKIPLLDGSDLEFTEKKIFLLKGKPSMRTPVLNGDFALKGGGRVLIQQGMIKQVLEIGSSSSFIREGGPMFPRDAAPQRGDRVSNAAPGASAKSWILKNQAGDELEFKAH